MFTHLSLTDTASCVFIGSCLRTHVLCLFCMSRIYCFSAENCSIYRTCWLATIFQLRELLSIHSTSLWRSWNSSCAGFCSKINERRLENWHVPKSHFFYSVLFLFCSRNVCWSEHAHFLGTCWTRRQRQLDPLMYNSCHVSPQPHQMVRRSTGQTKRASCGKPSISTLTTPSILSWFYVIQRMQFTNRASYAMDQQIRFT